MKSIALLLLFSVRLASAADTFSAATLKKYATEDPSVIFLDPKIACHLTVLMGAKKLSALKENMQSQEVGREPDATGAFLFPGGIRGLNRIAEGIVALHPRGTIWVGYLHDGKIEYFTNDKEAYRKPPPALEEWGNFDVPWKPSSVPTDNFAEKLAAQCSEKKLAPSVKQFEARRKGTLCDTGRPFSEAALVTAKAGEKIDFRTDKAYLVDGDLVQLASPADPQLPFACALYRVDSRSKKAGELPRRNLIALDDKILTARAALPNTESAAWLGTWDAADSQLVISLAGQQLIVTGSATAGANVGEVANQRFDVVGANAVTSKVQPKDAQACDSLKLYRFNNALYASEDGQCGGVGVSFNGIYIKARDEKKSK